MSPQGYVRRGTAGVTAAALIMSQFVLLPSAEASHLGSATASAGSVPPPGVSAVQSFQPDLFTGRATTSIPIAVPPGRKGLQPAVALSYSSSGRNGWLGVGWSLDLGYIERSTKHGVPKYDASDAYTFMFQSVASELVNIPDGTYRAKDEGAFLKFTNNGVSGWEVRDKSGMRYFFGRTAASQIDQTGQVFRWALDKVLDPNGNTLTITYVKDQNQLYPSRCDYTGHEPTSLAPANYVEFILEDRPDDEVSYRSGFPVTTVKRLKEISAYAQGGQLARKYVLSYTTSQRTNRSLISSLTQFGADGTTSLPATTFIYQDTGSAAYPNLLNNFQSPPSVPAWNVRKASLDTGHENFGCVHPYQGLPWNSPTVVQGSAGIGPLTATVSGDGRLSMNAGQDHFGHGFVYVYTNTARTISVPFSHSDVDACVYREDASGVQQFSGDSPSFAIQPGWSIIHITAYHQHQGWSLSMTQPLLSQVDIMNPNQIPLGVPQLAGDANGDAKTDLIKFDPSNGSWTISCATSCTLPPPGTWLSGFGSSASLPLLGDWNSDGRTDIGIYAGGGWQFATSTGTSFQTGTMAAASFGNGTPLTGDFNGDAVTDIGTYNSGSWSVALGTGSSFNPAGAFALSWGGSGFEATTGDFNGDGLTDIGLVNASTGAIDVRLSTGSGWTLAAGWIGSFGGSNPHSSADFNGDGLTDAVYYNRSTGQVVYAPSTGSGFGAPATLPVTFSLTSSDDTIQVGDFNGDGIADPAVFNVLSGSSQIAPSSLTNSDGSNAAAPDALRTIQNGLGGTTTIKYQPSSSCGCAHGAVMPFVLPVVQQVSSSDGLGNTYTTNYLFHDGFYDGPTKEFRGFAEVKVFDAEGNKSITVFDQGEHKKGRPLSTEFRDASETLWTKSEQTWTCTEPYPGVHFVTLDQTDAWTYDGDATFKQTRSRFAYDAYGNVTRTDEDGEVTVTGDERSTTTTFAYNTADWVLNKPTLTQTLSAAGAVVAQHRFSFDAAGNLTKQEEWLNAPAEAWPATSLTYDAYGNIATVTDALARTTTNTYDAAGTYLIQIANVLGHTRQLAYDARFGAVTGSTDQNGVTTTQYDTHGRVTKVIGPTDSAALPTISYAYDLSINPAKTTVSTRIQSGQPELITAYTFTDGLGRAIQTRVPAEDPAKHVVNGAAEFNARGLTVKQWAPYLDTVSITYKSHTLVAGLAAPVTYTYDPLGRALTVTGPDGSVSSTSYNDGIVTSTDPLGHQTRRTSDVYGRLIKVEEINGTATYTTTYAYDTLNNLVSVTDHAGNATTISYDSLGRKLSMSDPDMGQWAYAYDAVDNLTSQTDARGVVTNYIYDQLNRVTQKSYTIPPGSTVANPGTVTYVFDDSAKLFAKGKLTAITDGSGSSSFDYDNLGRLITESKTIDGVTYQIQRSYDLLGRLLTLTYPDGGVASYTYNAQGGIETVAFDSAGTGHTSLVSGVDYNAAGQLTKITYGNGSISDYTYNPQTLRLDRLKTTGPSGTVQDFGYSFDANGNVTAIQDTVHTATQSFQYDALNRLTQASGAYGSVSYAYDPLGNLTAKEGVTMTYGAGTAGPHAVTSTSAGWQLAYDANGNLTQKRPSSDLLIQNMVYDTENRLVEVEAPQEETVEITLQPGWNFFSLPVIPANAAITSVLSNFNTNFEQVSRHQADGTFLHYVGNSEFDDFNTLEYGVGYEVYCKAASPVTVSLTGKLPSQALSQSLSTGWRLLPGVKLEAAGLNGVFGGLTYDQVLGYDSSTGLNAVNQVLPSSAYFLHLTQAGTFSPSLPANPTTEFVYDGDGGRVKQIAADGTTLFLGQSYELAPDGTRTKYVFAGSQRIAAIDRLPGEAALPKQTWLAELADWVFGPSAEAAVLSSNIRFYHTDHLGSSNVITDGSGQVVELAENTPFGSLSRHEGSVNVPQKFTGQRSDDSTGLYFYNARYYDPDFGRFIQADPFVQEPTDPQTLNRYTYVRNNPINLVDPSGHFFGLIFAAIFAIIEITVKAAIAVGTLYVENALFQAAVNTAIGIATGNIFIGVGNALLQEGFSHISPSGRLLEVSTEKVISPNTFTQQHNSEPASMFLNGILTSDKNALDQALGYALTVFYNPTAGAIADFVEAFALILGNPTTQIDLQLTQILNDLADAGTPVHITAFSEGNTHLYRVGLNGARFAPGSTVTSFSSPLSEQTIRNALPRTVHLDFQPTDFMDPINLLQGADAIRQGDVLRGVFLMYGGYFGLRRDIPTLFRYTSHKLPKNLKN